MARPTVTSVVSQVALPRPLDHELSKISARTHVPKSVIIRKGVEMIVKQIKDGKIKMGFDFGDDEETGAEATLVEDGGPDPTAT